MLSDLKERDRRKKEHRRRCFGDVEKGRDLGKYGTRLRELAPGQEGREGKQQQHTQRGFTVFDRRLQAWGETFGRFRQAGHNPLRRKLEETASPLTGWGET